MINQNNLTKAAARKALDEIDRHTWSRNLSADQFDQIQATVHMLSSMIERASLKESLVIMYGDFLYDSISEKRDQLRSIVTPEQFDNNPDTPY